MDISSISNALIRPGNADLNMTLALALVSMICWFYFIFAYAGPKVILYDLFGTKAKKKDVGTIIYYCLVPLFLAVGVIEILSIVFRPVSLTFRLFGNIFGAKACFTACLYSETSSVLLGWYPFHSTSWSCSLELFRHLSSCYSYPFTSASSATMGKEEH